MNYGRDRRGFSRSMALAGALMAAALCGCRSFSGEGPDRQPHGRLRVQAHERDAAAALLAELGGEDAFAALTRYLYRWHLDENDFKERNPAYRGQLWIRRIEGILDAGDNSRFLEVVLPAIGVIVTLKKSDYIIEELKLHVKSDGYKITEIHRVESALPGDPRDYAALVIDVPALYEKLFATRMEAEYPDEELFEHLRSCAAKQCGNLSEGAPVSGLQTVWVAPLSPLANEIWMYWENRKVLFRFVSDIDIRNKEIWNYDATFVTSHDIITQTVVSYEEAPGQDSFMTRDQVGRILYNCMAFGRKMNVESKK